jgi:hypothetical protein
LFSNLKCFFKTLTETSYFTFTTFLAKLTNLLISLNQIYLLGLFWCLPTQGRHKSDKECLNKSSSIMRTKCHNLAGVATTIGAAEEDLINELARSSGY